LVFVSANVTNLTAQPIDFRQLLASLRREHVRVALVAADRQGVAAVAAFAQQAPDVFVETVHLTTPGDLREYLGTTQHDRPESPQTTRQLAVQAFRRASVKSIADSQSHPVGVAVSPFTTSRGHVVAHSRKTTSQCTVLQRTAPPTTVQTSSGSVTLIDSLRRILLNTLAQQLPGSDVAKLAVPDEFAALWQHEHGHPPWQELMEGRRAYFGDFPQRPVMFPGSFNPPHQGHRQMVQHATARLGVRVHLEISVTNADKPELDYLTIKHRTGQAETLGPVVLTRAARFVDKSRLFPGATFLIGADTALRLDDPRFYNHSIAERERAVSTIAEQDCRFLVFGRLVEQSFLDARRLSLSPTLRSLCEFVPAIEFRVDVSSREIRESGAAESES
jgi:hypothetical protein